MSKHLFDIRPYITCAKKLWEIPDGGTDAPKQVENPTSTSSSLIKKIIINNHYEIVLARPKHDIFIYFFCTLHAEDTNNPDYSEDFKIEKLVEKNNYIAVGGKIYRKEVPKGDTVKELCIDLYKMYMKEQTAKRNILNSAANAWNSVPEIEHITVEIEDL